MALNYRPHLVYAIQTMNYRGDETDEERSPVTVAKDVGHSGTMEEELNFDDSLHRWNASTTTSEPLSNFVVEKNVDKREEGMPEIRVEWEEHRESSSLTAGMRV
jgi:hypothetical protein